MNIYCFSTLSFAKLQFKSVINKVFHKHGVASFTDAWIETRTRRANSSHSKSHLLQMRGLKPSPGGIAKNLLVASFTDAWIETAAMPSSVPPADVASFTDAWIETREGLLKISSFRVASFTDAWIETSIAHLCTGARLVASFTDAWIETSEVIQRL